MEYIEHIHEPDFLKVMWQADDRLRRHVANLYRENDRIVLKYLNGTQEFQDAVERDFKGLPAFQHETNQFHYSSSVNTVVDKRLPSKDRLDHGKFLESFGLSPDCEISSFGLLGYSEGQLPSDWFSFIHPFETDEPCELVMELAGTRHCNCTQEFLNQHIGEKVYFVEEDNQFEPTGNAFKVFLNKNCIGYINRAYLEKFKFWFENNNVHGKLFRANGTLDRPRAFIFLSVK